MIKLQWICRMTQNKYFTYLFFLILLWEILASMVSLDGAFEFVISVESHVVLKI